jgi:hypothetical protein
MAENKYLQCKMDKLNCQPSGMSKSNVQAKFWNFFEVSQDN